MKHDESLDLGDPEAQSDEDLLKSLGQFGSIHLVLQWIYCREKYFQAALNRVEETLNEEIKQRDNIQEHLKQYRGPFKSILENEELEIDSDIEQDKIEIEAR